METTFVIVKPNVMKKGQAFELLSRLEQAGLKIRALKLIHMDKDLCARFYDEHKNQVFFGELLDFMTASPVIVLACQGASAVSFVRKLMGATDPSKAEPGTLRRDYGDSLGENAVHGSDSIASAKRELALFFTEEELHD